MPDTQEAGASATSTLKQDTGGAWADAAAARAAKNAEKEAKAKVKKLCVDGAVKVAVNEGNLLK